MKSNVISMPRSLGQRSAEASPAILDIACGTRRRCAVRYRRISHTPARPGEGLLSDHIAGVRPVRIRPANSGQPIAFATRGCPHVMAENGVCHVVG